MRPGAAPQKGVDLGPRSPPSCRAFALDPAQIRQVLVNLVQNAAEAMRAGRRRSRSGPAAFPRRRRSSSRSRTTAPGSPKTGAASIFEPFFTDQVLRHRPRPRDLEEPGRAARRRASRSTREPARGTRVLPAAAPGAVEARRRPRPERERSDHGPDPDRRGREAPALVARAAAGEAGHTVHAAPEPRHGRRPICGSTSRTSCCSTSACPTATASTSTSPNRERLEDSVVIVMTALGQVERGGARHEARRARLPDQAGRPGRAGAARRPSLAVPRRPARGAGGPRRAASASSRWTVIADSPRASAHHRDRRAGRGARTSTAS